LIVLKTRIITFCI